MSSTNQDAVPVRVRPVPQGVGRGPQPPPRRIAEQAAAALLAVREFCSRHAGWISSGLIHAVALVAIALIAIRQERNETRLGLEAALGEKEGQESFENLLGGAEVEIADASTPEERLVRSAEVARQLDELAAADALDDLSRLESGGGDGGAEGGSGAGRAPGLSAGFFGTQGEGKTFVYVVDMSGSMTRDRFTRAKSELVRSINKLKPEQKFYVFFFNDQTYRLFEPRPAKGLLPASSTNKSRAARWIGQRQPSSTTNPNLALQLALEMNPDVVFLLTDGELDDPDAVRTMIRRKNSAGCVIHTIAFENEEGARTLEAIARENNGEFRFVK